MADRATIDITRASSSDAPTIGDVLAQAFHDDPVFSWLVPDAGQRRTRLPSLFRLFVEYFLVHEETYLAGHHGAALWSPAGVDPIAEDELEIFGEQLGSILGGDADRASELQEALEEHHPERPSFYLQFVGVVPERQGRGVGSRLLTEVLARCDAAGTPAFLEATSPQNRRLYERHGFETVDDITLEGGPTLWSMWREPATTAPASA